MTWRRRFLAWPAAALCCTSAVREGSSPADIDQERERADVGQQEPGRAGDAGSGLPRADGASADVSFPGDPGPSVDALSGDTSAAIDGSAAVDTRQMAGDGPRAPVGTVPMFVAAGMGGRTVTSCDDGQTWIANHAFEAGNEEHSAYTHKGFAHGQGSFMAILAWGANGSLKISEDGVVWRRAVNIQQTFYGGIAFGGGAFVLMRQGATQLSRDAGKTWKSARTQPRADFREGGGGEPGIFAGGSGSQLAMSWDGGDTWSELSGCPSMDFGGIGQHGGIAVGGGNLSLVSRDGASCRVSNGGKTVERGSLGASRPIDGKLFWVSGKFWVPNGNEAFTSDDGATWTRVALAPRDVAIHAIARSDGGSYVGVDRRGAGFYRGTDGTSWTRVAGPAGNMLLRVAFGYGLPSVTCPAR